MEVVRKPSRESAKERAEEDVERLREVYQKGTKIRVIAPYPTLAVILSQHKPLLISEEGWDYIVSWVADIGAVIRSRAYMVSVAVSLITQVLLSSLISSVSVTKRAFRQR